MMRERLPSLDGARALATAIVLLLHGLLSFLVTPIGWAIKDRETSLVADFIVWTGRAFIMPVFFLLAGFFSRQTYDRGNLLAFVRERARRLLWPFLLALVPVSMAMNALWDHGRELASRGDVAKQVPALHASELPVTLGHLWFLYYLLFYSALVPLLPRRVPNLGAFLPFFGVVPVAAILLHAGKLQLDTPLSFLVELPIFFYFLVFFLWGFYLDEAGLASYSRRLPLWSAGAIASLVMLIPALLASSAPDAPPRAPAGALIASAAFTCFSIAVFLGLSGRLFPRERPAIRRFGEASYFTYIVHLPIVVLLQIQLAFVRLPGPLKFAAVVAVTTALCLGSFGLVARVRQKWFKREKPGFS